MAIKESRFIWFNGEMLPWEKATVHVMTHALHYASSVFEGVRCYETHKGPALFRLGDHTKRLFDSAKVHRLDFAYSAAEIDAACREVLRSNGLGKAYVRPLVFRGYGGLGVCDTESPIDVVIAAFEWGTYLGSEALEAGVDVCVSSWNRPTPNTIPSLAKSSGNYLSSQLIGREAARGGFAEGIALDQMGCVSEGSGENVFLVRDGVLYTPPAWSSILPGLTRDSVMRLAADMGIKTREEPMPREAMYIADEMFFTGTAAEITPVRSVDQISIADGKRGPVTAKLQRAFFGLFSGETPDKRGWLDFVTTPTLAVAEG